MGKGEEGFTPSYKGHMDSLTQKQAQKGLEAFISPKQPLRLHKSKISC